MSDNATDFYHQKTDDELQFLVEHPEFYQPSLIEAACRELRRRGVQPAPAAVTSHPEASLEEAAAPRQNGRLLLLGAAVLVLGMGADYVAQRQESPATVAGTSIAAEKELPKGPPMLVEVATYTIPNYDGAVTQSVEQQTKRVPAAERAAAKKAEMPLRQYRELAKRFWTAETKTEYVLDQARRNKLTQALPGHVETAEAAWEQWNKATAYSYKFGPAMATHLDLMKRVARQQQEGLSDLLIVANNPQAYENDKTRRRAADVSDLLSGLLPKSPVTGRPYHTIVRHLNL